MALVRRQPFNAGNLTAVISDIEPKAPVAYAIYSYSAIIAWEVNGVMVIAPNAYKHSQTTSKHANMVKRAWGLD